MKKTKTISKGFRIKLIRSIRNLTPELNILKVLSVNNNFGKTNLIDIQYLRGLNRIWYRIFTKGNFLNRIREIITYIDKVMEPIGKLKAILSLLRQLL
jgi:hypothetical protein